MWATILQVEAPACAWCRKAASARPDVGIQVKQYYARPRGRSLEVVELSGTRWREAVDDIRKMDGVSEVEVLQEEDARGEVRIAAGACPLPAAIEASGVVPQTPFESSLGCDKWLLLAPQEHARVFFDSISKSGVQASVVYSGEYAPQARLTPRQREVLALAVAHGYYEYPRRITLSHLAEKAGVAKSTLSQTLMLIEREVMHQAAPALRPVRAAARA